MKIRNINIDRQHGVALFISLVSLLVLTIIGVSSVQTTSLEVRMTRNEHDTLLAFQAAESALRDAEMAIELIGSTDDFTTGASDGLHVVADLGEDENWQDDGIWGDSTSATADTDLENIAQAPRYIVEHLGTVERDDNPFQDEGVDYGSAASIPDRVEVFRITALGVGATENARVRLQSTYGRIMD